MRTFTLLAAMVLGGATGLAGGFFLFPLWPVAALLLAVSCVTDLGKEKKIYNLVTLPAAALGLAYHATNGNAWFGLTGLAAGFLILWPVYWLGGTRAGDVKLLAAYGALLGSAAALATGLLASLLFLGYAVVFYVRRSEIKTWISLTCLNSRYLMIRQLNGGKVGADEIAGGEHTAPYAPFIAAGALIYHVGTFVQ